MELQTPRLLLRPWEESDAEALYELAKDPDVGPAAGWNVHKDVEESREIIRTILSAPGTFAIFGRRDGQLRGSCGFFPTRAQGAEAGELEIGYWVGKPFWGRGIAPEAVEALLAHCFTELGAERVWCAYFDGNEKSHRCQEKCGFRHVCDTPPSPWPDGTERPGVCQAITRQEWEVRHG